MKKFQQLLAKVGALYIKDSMLVKILQKARNHQFYKDMNLEIDNWECVEVVKHYVKWKIVEMLQPQMKLLEKFSIDLHLIETTTNLANYPTFPYYGELFVNYIYTTKSRVLRRRKFN